MAEGEVKKPQGNVPGKPQQSSAPQKSEAKPQASAKEESKSDRFKRLATKRVKNAISKIELITNLAGPSYEYKPEEVTKILGALQASVDKVKAAFSKEKISKSDFEL